MNVYTKYIIELNEQEAIALKKWLGKRSDNLGKDAGIDSEGNLFLSELYDVLPYEDDN